MADTVTRTEHTATISTGGITVSRTVTVHDGARLVAAVHLDPIRLCDGAYTHFDADLRDELLDEALEQFGWRREPDAEWRYDHEHDVVDVDAEPIPDPRGAARARIAALLHNEAQITNNPWASVPVPAADLRAALDLP